jgi:predicted CXXCH cytochrome family protein
MMCHKNSHKAVVDGYLKSSHPKAMQKADAPGAIVADFTKNAPFAKDKVAYTLGSGKFEQAYLDGKFQVLPGAWDVKNKAWKAAPSVNGTTQCVGCHSTGQDAATGAMAQMGVGCESCHGPGGDHMKGPKANPVVKLKALDAKSLSQVCGQCHSVGKSPDGVSASPRGFVPGGGDLAKSFVDAKPTGPGRNQQYSEFLQSKHYQAGLSCSTCHEPHGASDLPARLKKPLSEQCLSCHGAKIKDIPTHAPSAPAGSTCATCHMPQGVHSFVKPQS